MLEGSFYNIVQSEQTASSFMALLALNAAHPVFEGHFPGQPVVPGVCMMQTIQELLEKGLQSKVLLRKATSMKFLVMINPVVQPQVTVSLQYTLQENSIVKVNAVIKSDSSIFMKFQGTFSLITN